MFNNIVIYHNPHVICLCLIQIFKKEQLRKMHFCNLEGCDCHVLINFRILEFFYGYWSNPLN